MALAAAGTRDARGRFVPGISGNPAGKQPGTLNKATLWRQAMAAGDELEGRRQVIARMRDGDLRAAMFVLKQIDGPDRKVAALALPIPPGSDVATVFGSIKAKMILGEVSPDEALAWFTALEKGIKVVTAQLMDREVDGRMDAASAAAASAEATGGPDALPHAMADEPAAAGSPDRDPDPDAVPDPGTVTPSRVGAQSPAGPVPPAAPAADRGTDARPPSPPAPAVGQAARPGPGAPWGLTRPSGAPPCISPAFPGRPRRIAAAAPPLPAMPAARREGAASVASAT